MQQLSNLNEVKAECDRVVNSMLDGSMTRDDGLFATATTLQKLANEFAQFVTYALPILHAIDQAMLAAQQAAQAQAAQAQMQATQAAQAQMQATQAAQAQAQALVAQPQADVPPANVVPIGAGASTDVQVVASAPGARQ